MLLILVWSFLLYYFNTKFKLFIVYYKNIPLYKDGVYTVIDTRDIPGKISANEQSYLDAHKDSKPSLVKIRPWTYCGRCHTLSMLDKLYKVNSPNYSFFLEQLKQSESIRVYFRTNKDLNAFKLSFTEVFQSDDEGTYKLIYSPQCRVSDTNKVQDDLLPLLIKLVKQ